MIIQIENKGSVGESVVALRKQLKNTQITRNMVLETMHVLHNKIIDNRLLINEWQRAINFDESYLEQYSLLKHNAEQENEIYLAEYQVLNDYLDVLNLDTSNIQL